MSTETSVIPEPVASEFTESTAPEDADFEDAVEDQVAEKSVAVENAASEESAKAKTERTWSEEIEIAGTQLVEQVKTWLAEGNVRRLILRTPDNKLVLEIPLVTGAVVGGVLTIFAPLLAVLGAIASVLAHVKVEIVREEEPPTQE